MSEVNKIIIVIILILVAYGIAGRDEAVEQPEPDCYETVRGCL